MVYHGLVSASIFIVCCLTAFADAATLGSDEVDALRSIGRTLGKNDWDFSVDPCNGTSGWQDQPLSDDSDYANNVTCDCTFNNNNTCHVTHILLKAQNLPGIHPTDLTSLPFLQEIDLTRNFLSGNIPRQWGFASQIISISLFGNRLTGAIPAELANLSNLTNLVLEVNGFSGLLPSELGNLSRLERMLLGSNNFTGEIPETYANLTSMEDFRISDNKFAGQIPEFIFRKWRNVTRIEMEGSGLSGPIPSINAPLQSLRYIIISDLNGAETTFPQLNASLPRLDRVMFRSCNLIGEIPPSLRTFTTIRILDLSFNRLSGEIPDLSVLNYDTLFLNGNNFTGAVPSWILGTNEAVDVSYNNFTSTGTGESGCGRAGLNLFSSIPRTNNSGINVPCLRSRNCPARPLHSVYINCGGGNITVNGNDYEADSNQAGPSSFYQGTSWAFSSTGVFLNDDRNEDDLRPQSTQLSTNGGDSLYTDARLSPSSLTYYAFCLANASYRVDLHFAEIQFTNDDQSYTSLGKRMFDIYIQGQLEKKDYNIEQIAGGAGIPRVEPFAANVTDGTLDIHFRWAGKGTTSIPVRGVYGPLISAISIFNPAYTPPPESDTPPSESDNGITTGAVVGIVAGVMFAALLIVGILWWTGCLRRKSTLERDLKGIELQTNSFSLRQIKAATNDFHASNKIGEGGFGPVYKGILADGTVIAVKQLSARSKQGNREFVTEMGMILALQHPHLVKLYGCCIEGNQLMLIYEYPCIIWYNLIQIIWPPEFQLKLDWATRRKICIGIARGLVYLHEESRLRIVHRDIKATNVLLDKNLNPKISDFGLAKLHEEDNTHISTRIAGTYGYMAPEYAMHGRLTEKADVYSFGIVALEIVSGRCNTSNWLMAEPFYLLDYAHVLKEKGDLLDLVDTRIGSDCKVDEVMTMINIGLLCTNPIASARPTMSSVVSMLEGKASVEEFFIDSSVLSSRQMDAETVKRLYQKLEEDNVDVSETKSLRSLQ